MNEMIEPLTDVKQSKEALLNSGIIDFWVKFGLNVADLKSNWEPDDRMAAMTFLTDIWYLYPTFIEKDEKTY